MLPVVVGVDRTINLTFATSLMLFAHSLLFFLGFFGILYLAASTTAGSALIAGNIILLRKRDKRSAWMVFKMSSPYLLILFLSMMVDHLFLE